jgi:Predicted metal-binding integral membrane protein (DUF2182)
MNIKFSDVRSTARPDQRTQLPNRVIDMMRTVGRDRVFFVTAALVFLSSVAATTYMCRSMAGGMPMPGGWTMSMPWMKMPEQTWPGAASFECSWLLMIGHLSAWQHGLKLGVHCTLCCASLMGVLLTLGIMDLHVMSLVGAAIAARADHAMARFRRAFRRPLRACARDDDRRPSAIPVAPHHVILAIALNGAPRGLRVRNETVAGIQRDIQC